MSLMHVCVVYCTIPSSLHNKTYQTPSKQVVHPLLFWGGLLLSWGRLQTMWMDFWLILTLSHYFEFVKQPPPTIPHTCPRHLYMPPWGHLKRVPTYLLLDFGLESFIKATLLASHLRPSFKKYQSKCIKTN